MKPTTKRALATLALGVLWYFEVYGTGQPRDILGHPQPGQVTNVLPATIGPFGARADCERYASLFRNGDPNFIGRMGIFGDDGASCRFVDVNGD